MIKGILINIMKNFNIIYRFFFSLKIFGKKLFFSFYHLIILIKKFYSINILNFIYDEVNLKKKNKIIKNYEN